MDVTIGLAFLAGLANFLSPCAFILVPGFISYVGGRSGWAVREDWTAVKHGLTFFAGLGFMFIWINLSPVGIGGWMNDARLILSKIGGLVIVAVGIQVTGLIPIPLLAADLNPQKTIDLVRGYVTSALIGVFFSAGWRTCVGPVLGSILTMGMGGGSPVTEITLMIFFLAGLSVPFLGMAVGIDRLSVWLRRNTRWNRAVRIVIGILIAVVGILLFLGRFGQLGQLGYFIDLGL